MNKNNLRETARISATYIANLGNAVDVFQKI